MWPLSFAPREDTPALSNGQLFYVLTNLSVPTATWLASILPYEREMCLLPITQLSSSMVTRTKANEAYTQHLASNERLVIDLRNGEALSFSFLDQLIWRLRESEALQNVSFLVGSESAYKNLAQIAASRNAAIYYKRQDHDSPQLIPLSSVVTRRI